MINFHFDNFINSLNHLAKHPINSFTRICSLWLSATDSSYMAATCGTNRPPNQILTIMHIVRQLQGIQKYINSRINKIHIWLKMQLLSFEVSSISLGLVELGTITSIEFCETGDDVLEVGVVEPLVNTIELLAYKLAAYAFSLELRNK
ncbi:hypothetical protein BpHYR1_012759 [Brachionus plicatilis]|uniref:Uncharacterized protein n=1 Tax=Brachionus plicatilis TaxID=10195 RepID=A0A3M7STF2_BRAPC|nr:hypothetical protein BpHYR1_012759 [Brachionus plicatilis]